MSDWYKSTHGRIGGRKAIAHKHTNELALAGKYGEIWLVNDTTCAAIITSTRISKKSLPKAAQPVQAGDETLIKFPITDLDLWCDTLKIARSRELMIKYANKFGE